MIAEARPLQDIRLQGAVPAGRLEKDCGDPSALVILPRLAVEEPPSGTADHALLLCH